VVVSFFFSGYAFGDGGDGGGFGEKPFLLKLLEASWLCSPPESVPGLVFCNLYVSFSF
jgi:hypothetical protein